METVSEIAARHLLLTAGIVMASGSLLGFVAKRLRMPDIVLFLIAGIILGPQGLGWVIVPATSTLSWTILIFGASYILFDGGATLNLGVLSKVWISLTVIVTVGVVLTMLITGWAAAWLLNIPVTVGLLLGAAVAATDPATLVPVFKQVRINDKVSQFVVSESAFNDPMGAIVTFAMIAVVIGGQSASEIPVAADAVELIKEASIGIVAGILLGCLAAVFIAHERYGFLMEHLPAVTLIVVIVGYLGVAGLHASGFMAAFVAGLVMGNMRYMGLQMDHDHRARLDEFIETTSLLARMFIFILLGSQVKLELLVQYWWQGLIVVGIFVFVARPLTVIACVAPDRRARFTWREMVFIAWTRETGVIPGVMATILVGEHVPHADLLAAIIFMAILVTIIVQATTAKWVAGRLGLLVEEPLQLNSDEVHAESSPSG